MRAEGFHAVVVVIVILIVVVVVIIILVVVRWMDECHLIEDEWRDNGTSSNS